MKAPPMTASIKEALELKPCPFCQSATGPHLYTVTDGTDESREAQEPVAWRVTYADGETVYLRHKPSGDSGVYECAPLYTAPPADAGMREAFVRVLASLAAAISILERTPKAKKAVASDKMFDTMLDDYRKALEAGRQALTAPGASAPRATS